jgi:SWI/SNF-related matrix-associated actin-dependent regulator 1 of chromatin subfamily A
MRQLYDFQKEGVEFIIQKQKALLADEMGLGKTIQAITAVKQNQRLPTLVISPKSVIHNWKAEVEAEDMTAIIIDTKFKFSTPRLDTINEARADFYIVNYDILTKTLNEILKIPFKSVILDEIHYAKNYRAKRTKAVEAIIQRDYDPIKKENPIMVVGLSGTPILNHGVEIHQIAKLINPYCLGYSFFTFADMYCREGVFGGYEIDMYKVEKLNERLKMIMLRRRKADVLTQLPDKTRQDIEMCIDENAYRSELRKHLFELRGKYEDDSKIILAMMARERQIAGKLKVEGVVDFLLDRLAETDEKIVVFAHHTEVINQISQKLTEAGYTNTVYVGEMNDEARQKAIQDFKEKNRVIIISIHAGGTGINLQFANYVVFAELDWSPSQLQQAEDRCHRIGQKNNVTVYYLFAKNTIDEAITKQVVRKMMVINAVIDNIEIEANEKKQDYYRSLLQVL